MKHPFLQGAHNAGGFQDQSVVDRYHLRPAYPPETFTILGEVMLDEQRAVLDVGCGTGNVARPLAEYVEHIDAIDLSLPMLERAKTLPGGDSPKIRWLPSLRSSPLPGARAIARSANISPTIRPTSRSIGSPNWRRSGCSSNWASA